MGSKLDVEIISVSTFALLDFDSKFTTVYMRVGTQDYSSILKVSRLGHTYLISSFAIAQLTNFF